MLLVLILGVDCLTSSLYMMIRPTRTSLQIVPSLVRLRILVFPLITTLMMDTTSKLHITGSLTRPRPMILSLFITVTRLTFLRFRTAKYTPLMVGKDGPDPLLLPPTSLRIANPRLLRLRTSRPRPLRLRTSSPRLPQLRSFWISLIVRMKRRRRPMISTV